MKTLAIVLVTTIAVFVVGMVYGSRRWESRTERLRARLAADRTPDRAGRAPRADLGQLPPPVHRYFLRVLRNQQQTVTSVHVRHSGSFNMSEAGQRWRSFSSEQWVATNRPGFLWNATIAMLPGLPIRVHDAYVGGEGLLSASLNGIVSVAELRGGGELAEGELMRYLAEAAWYPTALLPAEGVSWRAADEHSAYATLTDGDVSVTLRFTFDSQDRISTVRADARGRNVGDTVVPTPWQGRFWNYEERGGMLVPLDGEVAWLLPDGERPYWRGHIEDIEFQFSR